MGGWKHRGFWYDIGKIPDYIIANRQLLRRAEFRGTTNVESSIQTAKISRPSYVGKDCIIEDSAKLGPFTILSDRVSVKRGAEISETIVFEQTSLGENCTVEDSLIGEGVTIGQEARIGKGSIIAGQVAIPDRAVIKPGSMILN